MTADRLADVELRGAGFGRTSRLRHQSEFTMVRGSGCSRVGKYCIMKLLESPPDGQRRAAFSISRRYSKLAVERNRARRLFREAYHQLYSELKPCWIIFIPRHLMKYARLSEVLADARSGLSGCFVEGVSREASES